MSTSLESFRHIAGDNRFREWLLEEQVAANKYLTRATDPVTIHRAQGQLIFIEKILDSMDKAKGLR